MENNIKLVRSQPRYVGLDYIQSTGTQYINTNYIPLANYFKLDLKFNIISYLGNWEGIFGNGISSGDSGGPAFNFLCLVSGKILDLNNGTSASGITTKYDYNTIYNLIFKANNGAQSISDDSGILVSGNYNGNIRAWGSKNFPLFCSVGASGYRYANVNIYHAKMYSNDTTLVRDYVPVRRFSDDVLGLYDKVNNKFYTNAGSGEFIAGKRNSKNNIY